MSDTTIRTAETRDEDAWRRLWQAYLRFYRASVPEETTTLTWQRILDPEDTIASLVAERDSKVIGICNYLFHASTWSAQPSCYLQDLYVDPDARGGGAARQLILACEEQARQHGAARVYWLTQEFNAPARSLYDTLAQRTSFIVYRKPL
jgi:GNAT superfamily N-acetyltransferase